MQKRRRRIEETLISALPQDCLLEIFSFAGNAEIQFTIPFICKEFYEILDYAIKGQIIIRSCEFCKKDDNRYFGDFGLKKTLCPPYVDKPKLKLFYSQSLFVCIRCRRKCDRCKNWTYLFEKEEECLDCRRVVCLNCKPWCMECGDRKKCYDCIKKQCNDVFDSSKYYCQGGC